jgi:hypothetical protein
VIGTVDYMAPEQLADAPLDSRTDVYALGCVLYQALTGSVPFPTEAAPAKLYAHTHADRPSLLELVPDLPPALDRVIKKAMAKAPEDRFQSAADLGMAAAAAIEGSEDGPMTAAVGVASETVPELAPETATAGGPPTAGTSEPAQDEAATTPVPPGTPPLPPARRPQPPPAREPAPRRRRDLIAVALGVAVLLTAGAIAFVVFGGSDDEGSGGGATPAAVGGSAGGGSGGGGGEPESGPSPEEVERIAADVPAGGAANVTANDRGLIEQEGFERRATLVEARNPGLTEKDARAQALDELILNRWMRGEADAQGVEISDEQVSAELASPEFSAEAERLRSVGYLEGGVALDAEARIAAEEIFGDGSQAVVALTGGYGPINADELADLLARWRPDTACTVELAPLSPLCANGPEP